MNPNPKGKRQQKVQTLLGQRIAALRNALDLTQPGLASKAGVSPRALAALELGECNDPQVRTLERVADALSVSLDYLLGRPAYPLRKSSPPKRDSSDASTELYGRTA
jgi:transcriptional regulator with XRE-family HTH domain